MQARVLSALIATSLGWGMAGVGTRYLFSEGVTTFTVAAARTLTATLAVLVVGLTSGTRVDRSAWRDGSIIGLSHRNRTHPVHLVAAVRVCRC